MRYLLLQSHGDIVEIKDKTGNTIELRSQSPITVIGSKKCKKPKDLFAASDMKYHYIAFPEKSNVKFTLNNVGKGFANSITSDNIKKSGMVSRLDEKIFYLDDENVYKISKPTVRKIIDSVFGILVAICCILLWVSILYLCFKTMPKTEMKEIDILSVFICEYSILNLFFDFIYDQKEMSVLMSFFFAFCIGSAINPIVGKYLYPWSNFITILIITINPLGIVVKKIKALISYAMEWKSLTDYEYVNIKVIKIKLLTRIKNYFKRWKMKIV